MHTHTTCDEKLREMDRLLIQQQLQERWARTHPEPQTDWAKELTGLAMVAGISTVVVVGGWKALKLLF